jgi:hypothetical protein
MGAQIVEALIAKEKVIGVDVTFGGCGPGRVHIIIVILCIHLSTSGGGDDRIMRE